MTYDDDDDLQDEVSDVTLPTPPDMQLSNIPVAFTVSAESMQRHIVTMVGAIVATHFEKAVKEAVVSAVHGLVAEIARERIAEEVQKVLAEGWKKTNEYGEARGVASLKDRISEMLNSRDRYGNSNRWVDELVKTETTAALKGELAKEIEAAKLKLRAEVDQVTRAKLNEALRSALGVQS